MIAKQKKPSVIKLFEDRLRQDGRFTAFQGCLKRIMQEQGLTFGPARWQAMKEFGYEGPKVERKKYEEMLAQEKEKVRENVVKDIGLINNLSEARQELPPTADLGQEVDWVESHEAMLRLDEQRDKTKPVVITVEDVLKPLNGPAPSQRAVNMLCYFANHPAKLHEKLVDRYKRTSNQNKDEGEPKEEDVDVSLDDVRDYLDQLGGE